MLRLNAIVMFILVHFLFQIVALNKAKYVFQTSSSVYVVSPWITLEKV